MYRRRNAVSYAATLTRFLRGSTTRASPMSSQTMLGNNPSSNDLRSQKQHCAERAESTYRTNQEITALITFPLIALPSTTPVPLFIFH